jgi:hypothetical protein
MGVLILFSMVYATSSILLLIYLSRGPEAYISIFWVGSLKKPWRTYSKIDRIQNIIHINKLIDHLSIDPIAVNARMRFGVFMRKINPNGRGFESPSGQKTVFPKKYTPET